MTITVFSVIKIKSLSYIDCAENQIPTCLSGEESISAQRWIERLLAERGA